MARVTLFLFALLNLSPFGQPAAAAAAEPGSSFLPTAAEARGAGAGKVFVVPVAAADPQRVLDPKTFTVHFGKARERALEDEGRPAGEWLVPPAGELDVWLEGKGQISPHSVRAVRPAAGAAGQVLRVPVADAGQVLFDVQVEVGLSMEVHLWSAGPFRDSAGQIQGDLTRRRRAPAEPSPLAMPVGQAVAGLFEPTLGRYLLLSSPFEVKKGETITVSEFEKIDTRLILDLELGDAPAGAVKIALEQYGFESPPTLYLPSRDRIVAFWLELLPGETSLAATAGDFVLTPWQKKLAVAGIEAVAGKLLPWPTLEVELALPPELSVGELDLEVRDNELHHTIEEVKFTGNYRHTFRKLPIEKLELKLDTDLGELMLPVDFSSGESRQVLWEPELMTLEGRVYYDQKPHRAKLMFRPELAVDSDDEGRYRVNLLGGVRAVHVKVEGVPGDPHVEFFPEPITRSAVVDIYVPPALFSVRVIDAATRQGIDFARVEISNVYGGGAAGEKPAPSRLRHIRQSVRTEEDGTAWLPPMQPGALELKASAKDYLDGKPLVVAVPERPEKQEFELPLERIGGRVPLELVLASGAPASRAAVAVFDGGGQFELWRDLADENGKIEVPEVAGQLLISAGDAAFLALGWPLAAATPRLTLPAPAESFLIVQVKDKNGQPVEGAALALVLDGRVYQGDLLGFLTQAPPYSGRGGLWPGLHVPPRKLGILAYWPLAPVPATAATEIPFPWPQVIELRLSE